MKIFDRFIDYPVNFYPYERFSERSKTTQKLRNVQ